MPVAKSRKKQTRKSPPPTARRQMWAVVLFALGLLLGAFTLIEGGRLWRGIHNFLFGMFGISGYFWAPLLIYIALVAAKDKPLSSVRSKVLQVAVLIGILGGAFTIFGPGLPGYGTVAENISAVYTTGQLPSGGGIVGALFALPLLFLFESTGAQIIISLLIFVLVMLITGTTLVGIWRAAKRPVEGIEEAFAEKMEERAQRQGERETHPRPKKGRAANFAAYDVDIGRETPDEPPEIAVNLPESLDLTDESGDSRQPENEIGEIVERFAQSAAATPEIEPAPATSAKEPEPSTAHQAAPAPVERVEYTYPPTSLLQVTAAPASVDVSEELKTNAQTLVDTLKSFGVQTRITDICRGPSVTRYELQPSAGVKISKITGLADDIALNLATAGIRIEAPIPNKAAVGVEVPNKVVSMVNIRELFESHEFATASGVLNTALGKDIAGNIILADIGRMPHLLIAGSTGSGKSVCVNSIIISLLYRYSPEEVKLLMIDPKVVELGVYNGIPHLLVPVVTDPKKAAGALGWAVSEMMERYKTFAANGVKDLAGYNRLAESRDDIEKIPKMVIIIDELADLMMAAPSEVEDSICRLAQMARAAGMHLVIATQRPSVDVITGIIKANIPSRIAFAVSSQVDSRTILDMGGAEKLLGRGDMLFYPVGVAKPMRVQGCFVTESEVEAVVSFIGQSLAAEYDSSIMEGIDRHATATKVKGGAAMPDDGQEGEDEMISAAIECVVESGGASTSQLQRRLKLGYARAARIIDQLEQKGIIGPSQGSKPRQVLISKERWMEMKLSGSEQSVLRSTTAEESTPPWDNLPPDDPVISPEKGGVKPRPDEFDFA